MMRWQWHQLDHMQGCFLSNDTKFFATYFYFRLHYLTHTYNHFTALWTMSGTTWVSQYQKAHFAIFWIFWNKMKITQADAPTIWMDCHPIQTNWYPHLCHPTIFTQDALPYTTLPIYPGLGQAPNMLTCIPGGLHYLKQKFNFEKTGPYLTANKISALHPYPFQRYELLKEINLQNYS